MAVVGSVVGYLLLKCVLCYMELDHKAIYFVSLNGLLAA